MSEIAQLAYILHASGGYRTTVPDELRTADGALGAGVVSSTLHVIECLSKKPTVWLVQRNFFLRNVSVDGALL